MDAISLDAPVPPRIVVDVAASHDVDSASLANAIDALHDSLVDGADAILAHDETRDAPASIDVADGLATVVFVDDATWTQTLATHDVPEALLGAVRAVHESVAHDRSIPTPHDVDVEPILLPSRPVAELVRAGLSRRQADVHVLDDNGLDDAAIAGRLGIAENTVKVHRHRVDEKVQNAKRLLDVVDA